MKKLIMAAMASVFALAAVAQDGTTVKEKNYTLPKCAAPVASVVVGKLSCKAAGCKEPEPAARDGLGALAQLARMANNEGGGVQQSFAGVGDGMSAMLTTVLKETGCFDIQEREAMDELAKELALVGKKVEVQQADFMISGSITSINMNTDKKQFGGGIIPIVGYIGVTTKTADVGLDIKLIDVNRAKIVDSKTFEANNETTSTSLGGGGFVGVGGFGGALSSFKNTPMEPIIRDVLARVALYTTHQLVTAKGGTFIVAPVVPPSPIPAVAPAPAVAPEANAGGFGG